MESIMSATTLWWSKLGKWQALAMVITLGIFFFSLYIIDDKEATSLGFIVAAIAAFFFSFACAIARSLATDDLVAAIARSLGIDKDGFAIAGFAFAIALTAAGFAIVVACVLIGSLDTAFAVFVGGAFVFVLLMSFNLNYEAVKHGINKKTTRFSYAAEFFLILVPMLISILH